MSKFLTEETPGKVMALLGSALVSMFLLFGIAASNASYAGMETPLPNPFAPAKVVAAIDNAAHSYSDMVAVLLVEPVKADLAYYSDTVKWVMDNSSTPILKYTGLSSLASVEYYQEMDRAAQAPRVAGAYSEKRASSGFGIDDLYSMLIK